MNDSFCNALNTQKTTVHWMDALTENMVNMYTPGYKEHKFTFATFLNGSAPSSHYQKIWQGKSIPGTSGENLFFEGNGFFEVRRADGKKAYTRLGEFKFDAEGVYKAKDGSEVQGYILNDKGEIMDGTKTLDAEAYQEAALNGGTIDVPTTQIKLWIDPNNGKYLGKYEEYEFKEDGTLMGKSNGGKVQVPLYKVALKNFHNPQELYEFKSGMYLETPESGKPVVANAQVRGGLLELSNTHFKENINLYQQAKMQMELSNKLIATNKQLLEQALQLIQ